LGIVEGSDEGRIPLVSYVWTHGAGREKSGRRVLGQVSSLGLGSG
jgi:hypothetical protein